MSGIEAKLSVKSDAVPKFCRARPVPYALKEAIEKDLERLDAMGVIEKVNYSEKDLERLDAMGVIEKVNYIQ